MTRIVYVSHRSGGSLLFKHSDETFTATTDAYLAYLPSCPIHTIETYETDERDLVHFLAIQGLGNAGMINTTDFESWEDAVREGES